MIAKGNNIIELEFLKGKQEDVTLVVSKMNGD